MTCTAKVIAHSITDHAPPLVTYQLRYPKFIHGEAKTHRIIRISDSMIDVMQEVGFMDDPNVSRNASSSRAIPVERLIQDVMDDPVIPMHFGKNQPGMSAKEECTNVVELVNTHWCNEYGYADREKAWLLARDQAVEMARAFAAAGYHKQIVNRLLEPWVHINVVATATNWSNFFALRDHAEAQPEIQVLAIAMKKALAESTPIRLRSDEWHLPYVTNEDRDLTGLLTTSEARTTLRKLSVARCASVSYKTVDGKEMTFCRGIELHDKLLAQVPLHASPAEHPSTPDRLIDGKWEHPELHGNLTGWIQYRKTILNECV